MRSFLILMALTGCANTQQTQIRTALAAVGDVVQDSEVEQVYDELMSSDPSERWICLAVIVAENILQRVPLSDKQRAIVEPAAAAARLLCPQVIDVLAPGSGRGGRSDPAFFIDSSGTTRSPEDSSDR